ncbi:(+)/Pi cotransporter [Daphnia sinensis]|uniref:(+)/Pi cotransporter n=1 Tax=Daphnia sinensis TaxID=1820382 RepID=A0AAD5PVS6_9CRUS|nr:(+)/Pi cotransporter [Daphnia sinensis]
MIKFDGERSCERRQCSNVSYGTLRTVTSMEPSDEDPWAIVDLVDNSEKWADMSTKAKGTRILSNTIKILSVVGFLYFLICSLDLLASAFRLTSGRTAGTIFQQSRLIQNPVVGLMIGILVTVLVQSSSTSSSIIVSMVGANVLTVALAIPIIMGANVGTCVPNTIVSFAEIANKNEFRRAFAGAMVHDIFKWITMLVLFTVEIFCHPLFGVGYLEWLSGLAVQNVNSSSTWKYEISLLKEMTDPFVDLIVQLDPEVLKGWANDDVRYENSSLIRRYGVFVFENTGMEDWAIGLIILLISLVALCGTLICLVKILHSMMKGHIANVIRHVINGNIPYVPWLTGYIALLVGAGMTFLLRSSLVFTSALDPLIGMGFVSIERVYPLTLGSSIGSTATALLAALTASPDALHDTMQIAFVHLFFNVTGIVLFYPIPFMRLPIPVAKFLGDVTAKYRWFAMFALIIMFLILPSTVLGLSIAGTVTLQCVGIPFLIIIIAVVIINVFQRYCPFLLPPVMRNWLWLPDFCRSLEPYDRHFTKFPCCNRVEQREKVTCSVVIVNDSETVIASSSYQSTRVEEGISVDKL